MIGSKDYTGHEELAGVDFIHMGGRVYHPGIARVASPDLLVQDPYSTQSYNRYSYVFNNPLSYNDPTGYAASQCDSYEFYIPCTYAEQPPSLKNGFEYGTLTGGWGSGSGGLCLFCGSYFQGPEVQAWINETIQKGYTDAYGEFKQAKDPNDNVASDAGNESDSWWFRNIVKPWAESTGIDQYAGTSETFTDNEKNLILFLGLGGGAAPGKLLGAGSAISKPMSKFELAYHPKVWQRASEDTGFHQFPLLIDKLILSNKPQVLNSGYRMYRQEGSMFGNKDLYRGNYELGVHSSGIIDHRMFRPFNPK